MTVLRSARVKHVGATEAPELLTGEISEGQELESTHQSNQPHEIDHSDQSARGPICDGNSSHNACDNVC